MVDKEIKPKIGHNQSIGRRESIDGYYYRLILKNQQILWGNIIEEKIIKKERYLEFVEYGSKTFVLINKKRIESFSFKKISKTERLKYTEERKKGDVFI